MAKWIPERLGIRSADVRLMETLMSKDLWFSTPATEGTAGRRLTFPRKWGRRKVGQKHARRKVGQNTCNPILAIVSLHRLISHYAQLRNVWKIHTAWTLFIYFFNQGMLVHHNRNLFWKDASFHETVAASILIRALTSGVGDWTDVHNL